MPSSDKSFGFGIALAATALLALAATPAQARPARVVDVTAKTTAKATFGAGEVGGDYTGKISFPKVRPFSGGKQVPKKMVKAARNACYGLYAGGTSRHGTPYVKLVQRPLKYGGLALNDRSETKFTGKGKWTTWALGGSDHEPYAGMKIEVRGGLFDQYRNDRRNFAPTKFRFRGKGRIAHCHAFTKVIRPPNRG